MVKEWESNTWRDGGRGGGTERDREKKKDGGVGRDLIKQDDKRENIERGGGGREGTEVNIAPCNID